MQFGIQNEINFAKYLDHKNLSQVSKNFQELIKTLFGEVDNNCKIECWKSERFEKADIKIKIKNEVKGVSIKIGHNCSVHQENIDRINYFLAKIGINNKILIYLKNFIKGYVNNERVDALNYIKNNKVEIEEIKKALNDYYVKANLIIRFLFLGTEKQNYDCDAIIYGKPENFLWATKSEILHYLLEYKTPNLPRINFSALSIKSYDRNLRNNPMRKEKENDIQVKWYTIENDLKEISKKRANIK